MKLKRPRKPARSKRPASKRPRYAAALKPLVNTPLCMHAHVGFLARGRVRGAYAEGCAFDLAARSRPRETP
jgi:hypothetical protein